MARPPPFVVGEPRFWASILSEDEEIHFPVSLELYVAVREVLHKWTSKFREVCEFETKTHQTVLNVHGQPMKEVMTLTIPRLLAIYAAINNGTLFSFFCSTSNPKYRIITEWEFGTLLHVSLRNQGTAE